MTKKSGVTGKTVNQLTRASFADGRQQVRDSRSTAQQLRELDLRPGASARERKRLSA